MWQWSPSVIAELIASTILLVLAIYFPRRDLNRQARFTGVTLIFVSALWMLVHVIEIGLPVAAYKESMLGLQLVLGLVAATFWLFYILHYLGPRKLLTRRVYILCGVMPLIAILALSTNGVTGLMWTEIGIDSQNPYLPLQPAYGIVYWACMVYAAVLTLTGSGIIIRSIIRRRSSYSRESIYLLVAAMLPLITAFIEVIGPISFLKLSVGLTPWAVCIGAIILILNLPQFHLDQVIPIARDVTFERIGDCILVLDKQNRVLDLNPAAEQLTGYRISDAFGLSIEQIWPHQSAPMIPFNKIAEAGEKLVLERDGKQRVYDLRISTTTDSGGRLTGQVVLLRDITERDKAEEALRESEDKYRVLVESAGEGICVLQDGVLKFVNSTLAKTAGLAADEMTNKPFLDFVHPEDRQLIIERESRRIRGEAFETSYPFRAIDKAGQTRWLNLNAVKITWEGKPATLNFLTDITEHRQAEKALQERESQYRWLSEHITDGVWLLDMNLKPTYQSPSMEKLTGFTHEELMELPFEKRVTPESLKLAAELFFELMPRIMTDSDYYPSHTLELEYYRKDGTTLWTENKLSGIRDDNGNPLFILNEVRDVTERKLAEEKLLKSYESLQKTLNDALNTMVMMLEMRDPYTAGHQQRVADLATAIAREMKFEDTRIDQLRMAAIIHDIGKMYVPSDILSKPGRLSEIELSLIKTHPRYGYDIVKGMDFPCSVAKVVLQHHERLDGSGYPNQLKSADMLIEAKILAVADVIEAMASHRPYRPALGIVRALEEISSNKGKLYDPEVVDTCLELFNSGKFEFKSV